LLAAFERLERPRVLVVGDLILDRYTWGDAERVSQEAPVILLRADRREARLGGAGNVCAMLRGLEAEVICTSVVGADSEATVVRNLLADCEVDLRGVLTDPARPTTVKERFIGRAQGLHPHQILRVDSEVRDAVSHELEQRLIDFIEEQLDEVDIVLVSDYDKGVCTPQLLRQVIDRARSADVPVLVDPIRSQDYSKYRGATTMTPNRTEAGLASGMKIVTPDDAFLAGHKLCRQLKLDLCIVTLDRDGMAIVYPDGRGEQFSTQPKNVYDITGAGDMVLAMIGVALAGGLSPEDSVRLGNVAGGLEVEKVGVAVIPRHEIRARLLEQRRAGDSKFVAIDTLAALVTAHRSAGQSIVFTNGCFDLLHVGHLACLQEAAKQGDVLIVALNSDASIRRLKGPTRPVIQEHDRAAILSALDCVDYVVTFDADTPIDLLRQLQPDVLVKGGTYQTTEVIGHEIVESYGGRVHLAGVVDGMSTSAIVAKTRRGAA
jgi:D-beta-D-heptose 7-phosphate kinase/D-beta-D-heptose 1-phosphate adenosyltransferase